MERLIVHNFAGIRDITLDIGRVNVLIGPQATGKSICAKLLYYFKSIVGDIFNSVADGETKTKMDRALIQKFERYFPPHSLSEEAFSARYEVGDAFLEISRGAGSKTHPIISYSREFLILRNHVRVTFHALRERQSDTTSFGQLNAWDQAKERFLLKVKQDIDPIATFAQIFIPAGRSFYATLHTNIFTFLRSGGTTIDPFLREFGAFYEAIKDRPLRAPRQNEANNSGADIDHVVEAILCGRHERDRGEDYLLSPDGRRTLLTHASSGQQEVLPLTATLMGLSSVSLSGVGETLYVEEPEAHLFPTAQRSIVELMSSVLNVLDDGKTPLQLVVTTHSPYILVAFNNLLQAGRLVQTLPEEMVQDVYKIVPREQVLRPQGFRAYSLCDGTARSICCDDTGLIDASAIDEVSDDLALQFDKLLELEP